MHLFYKCATLTGLVSCSVYDDLNTFLGGGGGCLYYNLATLTGLVVFNVYDDLNTFIGGGVGLPFFYNHATPMGLRKLSS